MNESLRRAIARTALFVALLGIGWAAFLLVYGGFDASILGVNITTHDPRRPLVLTVLALVLFLSATGFGRTGNAAAEALAFFRDIAARLDRIFVMALAITVLALAVAHGSKAAGGGDSYGYISEADLFLSGHLSLPQPWTGRPPWPGAIFSFAPLGYVPRADAKTIVPTYAPGLPLLMATAKQLAGHCGLFWVVPLSGSILVFTTFGIGHRIGSSSAGVIAATLVATSPVFLYQIMQPMSDVPAAAAWTVSVWCALGDSVAWAAASGAVAAVAILIRPNLAPLAAIIGIWILVNAWRERQRSGGRALVNLLVFGLALMPGVVAIAALNRFWYGSPLQSGYGALVDLFSWSNILPNVKQYGAWFRQTQTAFAFAGVLALLVPTKRLWPGSGPSSALWLFTAFSVVLCLEYFAYQVWDAWFYLRFLLPCWPYLMLGVAAVLLRPGRRRHPLIGVAVILVVALISFNGVRIALDKGSFDVRQGEDKFPLAGLFTRNRTEEHAVIVAGFHSGSVRYYSGRFTLGFYGLDPNSLDLAVAWLARQGAHPYALLEEFEIPEFKQRFATQTIGRLAMPPIAILKRPMFIYLFDLLRPTDPTLAVELVPDSSSGDCVPPAPAPKTVFH